MAWADAVPNLLIGLREGLEAGLVVSILLAALRKIESPHGRISSTPVWLGVLGAVSLSASFAAVLTFSTSVLSSRAQEAVGGILSVLAVGLVTAMIFWMRRTAASLSRELRGKVAHALGVGAGALALTAFLAVGREGLETTLFLWTAVRASGDTAAPLIGAAVGLAAAVVLCALLYRQAVRLNLGVFFNRTALALIVIAAGVLSYGLGDLQDAGLIAGQRWVAFDLSAHVDPNAWWVAILTGVTDLSPRMTVLQVAAWIVYLGVVLPLFVLAGRHALPPSKQPVADSATTRFERAAGRRPWTVAAALVATPVVAAGVTISLLPAAGAGATTAVEVSKTSCAPGWTSARPGRQSFNVKNDSGRAGEINLDDASGAVVAEIETIGPATTAQLTARLGNGAYTFRCLISGRPTTSSATVQVAGARHASTTAVRPVTVADLTPPNDRYQNYAAGELTRVATAVAAIRRDLAAGELAAARADWLDAQLDWERVGASYDSFGDAGVAVDGVPDGLRKGAADPKFTGLHRLEYGLWHGQSAATLAPVARTLATDLATVRRTLTSDDLAGDPTNLPLRVHEILEDADRDHLSGIDDEGAGAAYAETYADVAVTRVVLGEVSDLVDARAPGLVHTATTRLGTLASALRAARVDGRWRAPSATPLAQRQHVDAAIGAALETLARVPDLLEVPPTP